MIKYFKEDTTFNFRKKRENNNWIKSVVIELAQDGKKLRVGDLNIIFCNDSYILDINRRFLNHDYYTDIITFDYCEGNILSGDIIISIDSVKENATLYKTGFENELNRVIIHGVLHLMGFKDKTSIQKKRMRELEERALTMKAVI